MKKKSEKYNGWANWDTWETALIIDNSQSSYNWKQAWKKNLLKKIEKYSKLRQSVRWESIY